MLQLEVIFGFLIFTVIVLFLSSLFTMYKGYKLMSYLKKNKYDRWREITSIGKVGPGAVNPFRGFSYIYGQKDNNDEYILRLKDSIKVGHRWIIISLLTMVVTIVMFFKGVR